jgi:flagellar biosynthesis chaperone FliJ
MSEPSNSEIMEKLGNIESKFDVRLTDILTQVQKTNGRVTKLEKWKEKLDIIADYRKEEKQQVNGKTETVTVIDWQKLLMYAMGLVATALAVISYLAKK